MFTVAGMSMWTLVCQLQYDITLKNTGPQIPDPGENTALQQLLAMWPRGNYFTS